MIQGNHDLRYRRFNGWSAYNNTCSTHPTNSIPGISITSTKQYILIIYHKKSFVLTIVVQKMIVVKAFGDINYQVTLGIARWLPFIIMRNLIYIYIYICLIKQYNLIFLMLFWTSYSYKTNFKHTLHQFKFRDEDFNKSAISCRLFGKMLLVLFVIKYFKCMGHCNVSLLLLLLFFSLLF